MQFRIRPRRFQTQWLLHTISTILATRPVLAPTDGFAWKHGRVRLPQHVLEPQNFARVHVLRVGRPRLQSVDEWILLRLPSMAGPSTTAAGRMQCCTALHCTHCAHCFNDMHNQVDASVRLGQTQATRRVAALPRVSSSAGCYSPACELVIHRIECTIQYDAARAAD